MSDPRRLATLAILAALVLAPLGVDQPGLPIEPRGDEATYRLMIASLLRDGDLRYDSGDAQTLFEAHPYAINPRVHLASRQEPVRDETTDDDPSAREPAQETLETVERYARPALYPLIAAPFVALFGGGGTMVLGGLLLAMMIALGLRRLGDQGNGALLTVAAFVLLSPLLPYAYLAQPEILAAALVWLGIETAGCCRHWRFGLAVRLLSGASIALAAWLVPMTAVAILPVGLGALYGVGGGDGSRAPMRRSAAKMPLQLAYALLGVALGLVLAAGADRVTGAIGPWTAGDGIERVTAEIENPLEPPSATAPARAEADIGVLRAARNLAIGRHMGLVPYFPFAVLALVVGALTLIRDRRRRTRPDDRFALLLAIAIALTWAVVELAAPDGSVLASAHVLGAPANRWILALYPLFFFLLGRRPRPRLAAAGGGLSAIVLGAFLIAPFGMPVADSTVHSHVRGWPLRLLPLELEWLDHLPDYRRFETVAGWLYLRRDEVDVDGQRIQPLGGIETVMWLEADRPVDNAHVLLVQYAPSNRVEIGLGGGPTEVLDFADVPAKGAAKRLRLAAGSPTYAVEAGDGERIFYRLSVTTEDGARPRWRAEQPEGRYIGVEITYLGDDDFLTQDLYDLRWLGCGVPRAVKAGTEVAVMARVQNTSGAWWPVLGPARVRLGARWRDASGTEVPGKPWRADFASHVPHGEMVSRWIRIEAPERPGRYRLDIELVFENVAWFSDRGVEPCVNDVEVTPP